MPVVQIDLEESATLRINVNDGELATIREGGERIELPAHVRDPPSNELCIRHWRACGDSGENPADAIVGDERSRLHTTIVINGTSLHVDAIEVSDQTGDQVPVIRCRCR